MGVLSCSRIYCDSIMCDTCVDSIGYVCYECQKEFKDAFPNLNNENEIKRELGKFMNTEKGHYINHNREINVDDFFKGYTRKD